MKAPEDSEPRTARYRVSGMDCTSCVAKIETAARGVPGVVSVKVSIASQLMDVQLRNPAAALPQLERTVTALGYHLARQNMHPESSRPDGDPDVGRVSPAYRRALWIVAALNLGYGVVETGAGFASRSQALKADALDFLGDGMITFLALVATGWSLTWRATAALLQGIFLGVLGFGVLGTTAYRVLVLNQPEAELMGIFGGLGLVVNVLAALALVRHRTGDANVRAVWLFSRNDALGNIAVVAAAGLVAWTGTAWPDLAVAIIVAGLFLHSSWTIIRHSIADLGGRQSDGVQAG
jgi:Co/Zn/Cd efflux system component/copper chaperone CopZ